MNVCMYVHICVYIHMWGHLDAGGAELFVASQGSPGGTPGRAGLSWVVGFCADLWGLCRLRCAPLLEREGGVPDAGMP